MAQYSRISVLAGEIIQLRAVFTDQAGNLIDPDTSPIVYLYSPEVEGDIIDSELEALSFSSATASVSATRLSQGFYQLSYEVAPNGAGVWYDIWVATINGLSSAQILTFIAEEVVNIDPQNLGNNTMIIIELADTITNASGDSSLEKTSLYYTTPYSPLYASPDLVRAEIGNWIDYIPDDTLALMLHWASKEADFITGWIPNKLNHLKFARTKFVVFDAAYRAIMYPGAGQGAGYTSGGSKQLGDLSIKEGNIVASVDQELLDEIRKRRQEWWRVVNAGGNIVPGEGLGPQSAIKGLYDPDRRLTGRLWESPQDVRYSHPTVNQKKKTGLRRRGRWQFSDNFPPIRGNNA